MAVETILQHAAAVSSLSLLTVQIANLDSKLDGGVQPKLWAELQETSELQQRMAQVEAFNKVNKVRKRGIALAPCLWNVPPIPCSVIVAISHGGGITPADGSITITLGSAEIGQGLHTKVAQAAQYVLSQHPLLSEDVPLNLIRVVGNNTEVIPAFDLVGGSGSNPQAVRCVSGACEQLMAKLTSHMTMNPLKKKTMQFNRTAQGLDGKKMTWPQLVSLVTGPFGLAGADLVARNTVCLGLNNNEGLIKQIIQGKVLPMLFFSLALTHTITCTCCYDEIKGIQHLKIYSHAHSLILSLGLSLFLYFFFSVYLSICLCVCIVAW